MGIGRAQVRRQVLTGRRSVVCVVVMADAVRRCRRRYVRVQIIHPRWTAPVAAGGGRSRRTEERRGGGGRRGRRQRGRRHEGVQRVVVMVVVVLPTAGAADAPASIHAHHSTGAVVVVGVMGVMRVMVVGVMVAAQLRPGVHAAEEVARRLVGALVHRGVRRRGLRRLS